MVRLKEVTKERIVAFREACYCLFGYRQVLRVEGGVQAGAETIGLLSLCSQQSTCHLAIRVSH